MYCKNCGKEISDQAKFCNHCGAPAAQPQPRPVQPTQQQAAPKKKKKKKKSSVGASILTILVALVVYFVVRGATTYLLSPKSAPSSSNVPTIAVNNNTSLTSSCIYGALYENDYLTYGLARLRIPGYTLLDGAENESDYLLSPSGTTQFNATKMLEGGVSFAATSEASILRSYSSFSNVSMVSFQKTNVGGYPVVRYILRCTANGMDLYVGELIIMPGETASETVRLIVQTLAENGFGEIDQIFNSLDISASYQLGYADTNAIDLNNITVK